MSPSSTRRALLGSAAALALGPLGRTATAAETAPYPSRPLRWLVAYPAGGGSDFLARQVAPQLGRQLGQTVVIENRPGAAGIIGTEAAARAPADGHTMVFGDNGVMVFNPTLYRKLPYSPQDFAPVGFMARFPLILVAHPGSGLDSARQLLQAVKQHPGRYSYASPGAGSPHHLAMELLKERTGSFIVHIPYRGTAMAIQDVIGGQVPMMVVDTAGGMAQIRAGRVKALAVLSKQRIPQLPDVPTLAEAGVKDFEVFAWLGLYVPRDTPAEIVARLSGEMQKAVVVPEVKAKLEDFGLQVAPSGPQALADFVARETAFWQRLIRERRLGLD